MKSVGGLGAPVQGVSSLAIMAFAVRHDLSYPALVAFVRGHGRLPISGAEFEAHLLAAPLGLQALRARA